LNTERWFPIRRRAGISGLSNLAFFFKEFIENLRRNTFVAITHGVQVTISLTVLGFLVTVMAYVAAFLISLQEMVEVYVYLKTDLSAAEYVEIDQKIRELKGVESLDYIPREEALKKFSATFNINLDDVLDENPLPPTYILKSARVADVEKLATEAEKIPGVWKVRYPKKTVSKLMRVLVGTEVGFALILLILLSATVSSINNVVRLSIYSRRREIRIMQLVGATHWFIRWPFIIEGVFIGTAGSILAILAILALGQTAVALLQNLQLFLPKILDTRLFFLLLSVALLAFGVIGGALSSMLAANRFLASDVRRVEDMKRIEVM